MPDWNGAKGRLSRLPKALSRSLEQPLEGPLAQRQAAGANRHIQTGDLQIPAKTQRPMRLRCKALRTDPAPPHADIGGRRPDAKGLIRTG
jgi:hypothetical protein